ncbi:MAG: type I-E CRISPR-associated protein Cse1/CasA [Opitutae bacterium]|nr:type I-E CRISPR-associated protein Cse1/CasA [Opitutae bacterium]
MTDIPQPAFNLLNEPWIPARRQDGAVLDISLAEALIHAGDYTALAETSPPNLIALYRVLLAVLHRALTTHHGPWKDTDRARWFKQGLPREPLRAYLEQWRDRFWLFHPEAPFMQMALLDTAQETRDKQKPWSQISLESANGSAPVVFDHSLDTRPRAIPCAQALRMLLGCYQFTPGGTVKVFRYRDEVGPLANTAAILPLGINLEKTLLLALHPFNARTEDLPAWEQQPPTQSLLTNKATLAAGYNDRYTRQTRAALLLMESDSGLVKYIRFGEGLTLAVDPNAPDPMAAHRVNKDGKATRITYSEGRAIWRDLPSLLPDGSRSSDIPPAVLEWATNLHDALGEYDAEVPLLSAGVASEVAKYKVLRWRMDRIVLPPAVLTGTGAAAELRTQIRRSEKTYDCLRDFCVDMAALILPDPKHKDTKAKARKMINKGPAAAVFFTSVERALPRLMRHIAATDFEAAAEDWNAALTVAAKNSWEAVRRALGDAPAAVRAEAKTWPRFQGWLKTLAPTDTPTTETTP